MLNTPLETFSEKKANDEAANLAKKYEDTNKTHETGV